MAAGGDGTRGALRGRQGADAPAAPPEIEVLDWTEDATLDERERAGGERPHPQDREHHPVRTAMVLVALAALGLWLPGALVFLGILVGLVVVHEAGHFVVARAVGMRPTEFFVGFGPTVWAHTTRSGVRVGLKGVIAGGYVKLPGMGPREEVPAELEPYTYRAASRPRRMAVILAGVVANFGLAVVLFAGYAYASPTIQTSPWAALRGGVRLTGDVIATTVVGLGQLIGGLGRYAGAVATGTEPDQRMMSLVGGSQVADGLLQDDPAKLLLLMGIFSASVGLFNLLPLLPLDGGHAAVVAAESVWARVRRRPGLRLDPNRLTPVAVAVVVALVALSASAMYLDVVHPLGDAVR